MNGINLANITGLFLGGNEYTKMYYGSNLIWQKGSGPTPPTPTDYEHQYFTTVAKGSGNITFTIPSAISTTYFTSISYSTDDSATWTTTNKVDGQTVNVTVPVSNGDKVLWKGDGKSMSREYYKSQFSATTNFDVEGNIMSLLNGDNFYHSSFNTSYSHQFYYLFYQNTHLISAENLILPATTLTQSCYSVMFYGCTSLTTAPQILPATTLANFCYASMFNGCTALTTAPELPATTLVTNCYGYMFNGCSNLNNIKMLATNISATNCLNNWVRGVSATGTFTKAASATIPRGTSGIPSGWTVINQ